MSPAQSLPPKVRPSHVREADCVPVPHGLVQAVQAVQAEKLPSTAQAWALQLRDLVAEPAQSLPP
jgi:hypothetical protein